LNDALAIERDDLWAPILAWVLLDSLPGTHKAAAFDKLQLRSALAEIFSSFGLHGEDAWRAAARVRLLLAQEDEPARMKPGSEQFWADPDVRWLAGVNESENATYFNKEAFEELVVWLQLPALAADARKNAALVIEAKLDASLAAIFQAAKASGYNVERFLTPPKLPSIGTLSS